MTHFGSYNPSGWGWTPDSSQIVPYSYKGISFPAGVHRLVIPLYDALIAEGLSSGVLPALHGGWCWGYENRSVRGSSTTSFHAYGLALDFNAPENGMYTSGSYHGTIRSGMSALSRKYGMEWGNNWSGRKDPMHIEVHLAPAEITPLLTSLGHSTSGKAPTSTPGRQTLRQGSTGADVATVQRRLHLVPSKHPMFGPQTTAAVKLYQSRHKITADGICGPTTWSRLLSATILPGERVCSQGNTGPDVSWLQRRLNLVPAKVPAFGPKTTAAVKAWQKRVGLKADGICGKETWAKLGANG